MRVGRRVSQHRARLLQGGEICVEALVTTGKHHAEAEPFWSRHAPPSLPPVEDVPPRARRAVPGSRIGHLDFVDVRCDPAQRFAGSVEASEGRMPRWLRMDGRSDDRPSTCWCSPTRMPPVTLDMGLAGWVPTIELTVLVRDVPAPGWLIVEQRARLMQDGWIDEECDIWDSRGRLVCQARQLAGYRLPS